MLAHKVMPKTQSSKKDQLSAWQTRDADTLDVSDVKVVNHGALGTMSGDHMDLPAL